MPRDENRKPPERIVDDLELWNRLKRSITPLDPHRPAQQSPAAAAPKRTTDKTSAARNTTAKIPRPAAVRPKTQPTAAPKHALTGLDRRTSQRLARGQIEAEARIDLHGESIETARVRLREFLRRSRARGIRTVLVITGKGSSDFARHTLHGTSHFHTPERQGRLRRSATRWFEEPEFTELISGFQPAHPKHGGGGAFYVRLRRRDAPRRP